MEDRRVGTRSAEEVEGDIGEHVLLTSVRAGADDGVVSREPDWRWYVTFQVDTDAPEPDEPAGEAIGADLGVKDFAAPSTGETIANPQHLDRKATSSPRCRF